MQVLDEVEPGGLGVAHRTNGSCRHRRRRRLRQDLSRDSQVRMGQPAGLGATGGPGRPEVIRAASRVRVDVGGSSRPASRPHRHPSILPVPSPGTTSATLLLNATYEPLCVVSSRRAIVLVLAEKAEPVDSAADVVHAATDQPAGARRRPADPLRAGALSGLGAAVAARGVHPRRADLRLLRRVRRRASTTSSRAAAAAPTPGTTSSRRAGGATTPRPTGRWPRWAGRCRTHHGRPAAPRGGCWAPGPSTRAGVSGSACPRA